MANAFESITRVVTDSEYVVRVWCEQANEGDEQHGVVTELIRSHSTNVASIATAIRTLTNWAAYEIADKFGNGRVVYREWP